MRSAVIGGVPRVVTEQEQETEGIEGFGGSIVSALRLLVAEAGVVDPASGAFRELSAARATWRTRESTAPAS